MVARTAMVVFGRDMGMGSGMVGELDIFFVLLRCWGIEEGSRRLIKLYVFLNHPVFFLMIFVFFFPFLFLCVLIFIVTFSLNGHMFF